MSPSVLSPAPQLQQADASRWVKPPNKDVRHLGDKSLWKINIKWHLSPERLVGTLLGL